MRKGVRMSPLEEQAVLLFIDAHAQLDDKKAFNEKYFIGKAYCDLMGFSILPLYDMATLRWLDESGV